MITSLQNPLVKQVRKLHQAKGRRDKGLLLLEGTHLLKEALAAKYPLETVCGTPDWQTKHPELWQQIAIYSPRVEQVSEAVLAAMATTVTPDGVVAIAPRLSDGIPQSLNLGLALETIQDPGNLGTMIRTAAAAGVDGLWLSQDSVDLDHPKVLRASVGSWFRLPLIPCPDLRAQLIKLQGQGVQVVATLPTAAISYWDVDLSKPTLIVLGNEASGLSAPLVDLADCQVQIPLNPAVESLNVSICAALLLYEARRQQGF